MSQASEVELQMLGLINEERTLRGLNPLAINADLNASSEDHSQWMLDNDVFSHTGSGGSSATQRIEANYALEGSWRTAENIGWQSTRGAPGIADDVRDIHEGLMDSPGHRANILNPDLEDIGIGVEVGDFDGFEAVMITQNFGTSDGVKSGPAEAPEVPVADADDPVPAPVPVADTPLDEVPDVPTPAAVPEPPISEDVVVPNVPVNDNIVDCPEAADVFTFFSEDCFGMEDEPANQPLNMTFDAAITTSEGTQSFDDWSRLEELLSDFFSDFFSMGCGSDMTFA